MQNLDKSISCLQHIVFVSREFPHSLRVGGIGTYVEEISNALVEQGFQVTVICASDDTKKQYTYSENGVEIIRLSGGDFYIPTIESNPFFIKKFRFAYRFFSYRYKIKKTIQQLENVSLIEVAEFGAEGLFLLNLNVPLVIRLQVPYLLNRKTNKIARISFQNFHNYWIGLLEFYLVKKAKYVTSCSNSLKDWFIQQLDLPKNKIQTIYNFMDTARLPMTIKNSCTLTESYTIFFAGSIFAQKGVLELIAAVKILRMKGLNITLCLAGKTLKFAFAILKQKEQENWHWCTFLGHINRASLYHYYKTASICCFPSWNEGLPHTCLEAMAIGGIVIGSSNGMAEIIEDGENGFLCSPLNAALLAETIEKVLKIDEKQRDYISNNAISTIQTKFSKEIIVPQMIQYYNEVI